jgi:hypothetical protein
MALLLFKLNTANEALLQAINDHDREKYTRIIEKLQCKMDKHLLEDKDEEPDYDDNTCFSSFEDRLNSATDIVIVISCLVNIPNYIIRWSFYTIGL